ENDVALRVRERDRQSQVVHDVQHRDGDDERQIEPVRDVDVRLATPRDRADEDEEVGHPDDGEPNVRVPFRLGVFLALRYAEEVARGGDHNEELIAPDNEVRSPTAGEPGVAGALHDVEGRRDQRVATEGEDDRGGV